MNWKRSNRLSTVWRRNTVTIGDNWRNGYGEENIGRYLKDNEVVHHINKNKIDNKIENLQLMTRSEHTKLHHLERKKEMEMMTY